MNAKVSISLIVSILLLITGCSAETRESISKSDAQDELQTVNISIDADGRVKLEGELIELDDLEYVLVEKLGDNRADFVITVASKTAMGLVNDVQQKIPARNAASIRYPEPQG